MFVIVVYDASVERVQKFLKICRKYLVHVQRSVFEGELSEAQLRALQTELKEVMDEKEDSVIIYTFRTRKYYKRVVMGQDKPSSDNFNFI
ncbi:CRISPR-associated endonuclease Cas2 [Thermovibrio sp.]